MRVYEDLSKEAFLQRLLGGFTQKSFNRNHNESLNQLIWKISPKPVIDPSAHQWARASDEIQITRMNVEAARTSKEGRIQRRQQQKDTLDILNDNVSLYEAHIDDSVQSVALFIVNKPCNNLFNLHMHA
ncbi:unnamed protein product [Arctia plantaginis]|uniref:Uncharacterized protein n=1 Tax=Arctia plantaginis TaxID=874455 RepID=A0A8S1ADK1_ARCPL|nr:unnamed protein product [Arctia plantaginis]